MKNVRILIWSLFTVLLFVSCERTKEVDIVVPFESKYVFNAYLTPNDNMIHAFLSKSTPIVGHENDYETHWVIDALVSISDGANEVTLIYNPDNFQYESKPDDLPIIGGKTYTAKIIASDGKVIQASCTVPVAFGPQVTIEVDSNDITSSTMNLSVKMSWNDDPQHKNFYRVMGQVYVVEDVSGSYDTSYVELSSDNNELMIDDEGSNGGTMKIHLLGVFDHTFQHIAKVQTYLVVCDENYYKYHQGTIKGIFSSVGGEPVFIESNIPGELGAFGAYNEVVVTEKWLR